LDLGAFGVMTLTFGFWRISRTFNTVKMAECAPFKDDPEAPLGVKVKEMDTNGPDPHILKMRGSLLRQGFAWQARNLETTFVSTYHPIICNLFVP
jgi:hypothetical protein